MRYDFKCNVCGKTEEREIDIDRILEEKDRQICSCGGKMQKLFSKPLTKLCSGMYGANGWNNQ